MTDPTIQLTFMEESDEDRDWTRSWAFVPRIGELVQLSGSWFRVLDVQWHTPAYGDEDKASRSYAMASLLVEEEKE